MNKCNAFSVNSENAIRKISKVMQLQANTGTQQQVNEQVNIAAALLIMRVGLFKCAAFP